MTRWLCCCADCQGPPISAVGLPLPPPYERSPSPEFHTPPIEVHPINNAETVRATLPSALNVINASSMGKLVQLVTASRLTLYHEGQIDPMKDEYHYQVKH